MAENNFTVGQLELIKAAPGEKIFLEGPPGCGKSSAAAARLIELLNRGIPAQQILVLTPQRSLAQPYIHALQHSTFPPGGQVTIVTLGGLAQRLVQLFWPIAAPLAGFTQSERPPVFLTLETAQYYMAQVAQPFLEQGYFEQISIDHNRLYSQILDNLNKSAVVGFAHTQLAEKLKNAWTGLPGQLVVYDQVQECANAFRDFCLKNNFLDFSLQFEIFAQKLWPAEEIRNYLTQTYRHVIYDNIEEDVPVAHDILLEWLPKMESSLLIYDQGGGNRIFLGADPDYAYGLSEISSQHLTWIDSFIISPPLVEFENTIHKSLHKQLDSLDSGLIIQAFTHINARFFTEMVEKVCEVILKLVKDNQVAPQEIAILTPYLSDSLRYALNNRLQQSNIPTRSIRPSRSLFDEPAARCLVNLARIAHPQWGSLPNAGEFRNVLLQIIHGIDLVRTDLITRILYRPNSPQNILADFDRVNAEMQERITFTFGNRYTLLRQWINTYRQQVEPDQLDVFLSRLFGELLSQSGFGFHEQWDAASVTAQLIESVQKFRRVTDPDMEGTSQIGPEYLRMVQEGVIAAQYLQPYQQVADAVLIAPAYTFIMANQPVRFQFWLDVGSLSWWQRLYQPLTHPYVLSRHWNPEDRWGDAQEFTANQEALSRLTYGLITRCKEHVYLCTNRINERGAEEHGPLLQSIQMILRTSAKMEVNHVHPSS